jgi:DNA-binding transcriptional regulator YhcF (GntR family)
VPSVRRLGDPARVEAEQIRKAFEMLVVMKNG